MRGNPPVQFGEGPTEKERKRHLVSSLPDARAALTGVDVLPAYFLTQTEADLILLGKFPTEVDITTLCRL